MAMATMVPRYTAEEVRKFPDDGLRYEVIRGELFVSPAPGVPHQVALFGEQRSFFFLPPAKFDAHRLDRFSHQAEAGSRFNCVADVLPDPLDVHSVRHDYLPFLFRHEIGCPDPATFSADLSTSGL